MDAVCSRGSSARLILGADWVQIFTQSAPKIVEFIGAKTPLSPLGCVAGTTGLEPATSAVTGQRSNQLSYVPTTFLAVHTFAVFCRLQTARTTKVSPFRD